MEHDKSPSNKMIFFRVRFFLNTLLIQILPQKETNCPTIRFQDFSGAMFVLGMVVV